MTPCASLGIKVHWVNRGGGCVFHLPGQLTAYFALPLDTFGLTVGDYVDRLHTAIVLVLEEFDLTGTFRPGIPGVFSGSAAHCDRRRRRYSLDRLPRSHAQCRALSRAL